MSLFVLVSESCRSDARTHGRVAEIEAFRDRVERTQSLSQFDPFPPPYLVKKKLAGRQGRLVAEQRAVGEHVVIVFLAFIIRGDRAYDTGFGHDPVGYGRQHFHGLATDEQVAAFLNQRLAQAPIEPKPTPTDAEFALLYEAFAHHGRGAKEELVWETKEWVDQVAQERVANQLAPLCAVCNQAAVADLGLHYVPMAKAGWGVWAHRSEGRLLLLAISTDQNVAEAETYARVKAAEVDAAQSEDAEVFRACRRSYPAYILADDDLWIELEKEREANKALSPEESDVLQSARSSDHPFPLFINGRAGSGKSTILQYLFADLLFHYLTNPGLQEASPPLYLTASGELLRVARQFVERLLKSESTFAEQANRNLLASNKEVLDLAFREFQPLLLSLVGAHDRAQRFARSGRVDYARFRRMWAERFGKDPKAAKECGADLSWHVIRSYIKGMGSETYLEPDDYEHLPENQITVTRKAFAEVHERVWPWYREATAAEGLWDDQDLARFIIDNDLATPGYPAIFCDESQDFTRIELELLLRLNLFSNRTLRPADIGRVPFVFAGDQFQTLNPTGFRWESIKAAFVEKFIYALDPARRTGRADLNYRELKFNYRSTHKIVRFSNAIQALRAALFELPDLKPQTPWLLEPRSFQVQWFRTTDSAFWKAYRLNPSLVVIVPCSEGDEASFVSNDPFLKQHIPIEDGVPVNVLSASRAKGCEYQSVIVYGFGTAAPLNVQAALAAAGGGDSMASDPDRSLPIQYFINGLYVAASRPKRRLAIVDTEEGFSRLWRFTQDERAEKAMLDRVKNGHRDWGHLVEGMTEGRPEDLSADVATDPSENAKIYERDGIAKQDPFLLKQAAVAYRSAGDMLKANECRARALEAEGSLLEAGEVYFQSGFARSDGVRCLWRAGKPGWSRLSVLGPKHPDIVSELEFQCADVISQRSAVNQVADVLGRLAKRLGDTSFSGAFLGDPTWRDALDVLLRALPKLDVSRPDRVARAVEMIDRFRECGIQLPSNTCAPIYFVGSRFADAIELWDRESARDSDAYAQARAAVDKYPQNLPWLAKLGRTVDIVTCYDSVPTKEVPVEHAGLLIDALRSQGRFDDAFGIAWSSASTGTMLRLAIAARRAGNAEQANRALQASLILQVRQQQWEVLAAYASSMELVPTSEWREEDLREWVESETDALQVVLVRALARSDELPSAPPTLQRQLSDFLRRYLRVSGGAWIGRVPLREAGAAIERAGRFTDALGFYEAITKGRFSQDEKHFARTRLVICKQRQLEHERSQGGSKASGLERDVRQMLTALGLKDLHGVARFPDVPVLGAPGAAAAKESAPREAPTPTTPEQTQLVDARPVAHVESLPDHAEFSVGPFKIEASRANKRCNITHAGTMETAFIKLGERTCGGEVAFTRIGDHTWQCPTWNVRATLPGLDGEPLTLDIPELGAQLRVVI